MKLCYSGDGEEFFLSFHEALKIAESYGQDGDKGDFWIAEAEYRNHGSFLDTPELIEEAKRRAWLWLGDTAEDYLLMGSENIAELTQVINDWLEDKYGKVSFFDYKKTQHIQFIIGESVAEIRQRIADSTE